MTLRSLDQLCVRHIVQGDPVTVQWGGVDYTMTGLNRETWRSWQEGGHVPDNSLKLLAPAEWYGNADAPGESDTINVYLDSDGMPCDRAEVPTATATAHRIMKKNSTAGGLTYELKSDKR